MDFWSETQERLSYSTPNGRIILKAHNSFCELNGKGFPNPKFTIGAVYIVRDALDVAISYSKHFGKKDASEATNSLLNEQNTLIDPKNEMHKILDFLSIQSIINVEAIISLTAFDRLKNTEEAAGFSEATTRASFFRKGTSKQWLLYPSTIFETLVSRNEAVMQKFDYL